MALTEDMIFTRPKPMTASRETLKKILALFGEQPKSSERVKLVMEADKLIYLAEMAGTSLLAFQHLLNVKEASTVKTEKINHKTAAPRVGSAKVHMNFKISGHIDSKSRITYTSLIRQIEAGLKKGHSEDDIFDGVLRAVIPVYSKRSYLDGRQDISIQTLRRIFRAHSAEKNSTELYTELES